MSNYITEIEALRKKEDEDTAADLLGWLNLVGLFWLEEGDNSFGNLESNKIFHPAFPQPVCGSFHLKNEVVTLEIKANSGVTLNEGEVEKRPLRSDADEDADLIHAGPLTMKVIIRGGVPLIRMWDRESEVLKNFKGFKYFPVSESYRVPAKYYPYKPHKTRKALDAIGNESENIVMGKVTFTLNGRDCMLIAEKSGQKLMLNFTDETNKDSTYGGGRKFYIPIPQQEEFMLDFNLTENWPCAYTGFATCPIPPKENHLPIRVEAGEKNYFEK